MNRLFDWLRQHAKRVRILLVVYWTLMFLGTHVPRIPEPLEKVSDKTLHFTAYCGLYFLLVFDSLARGCYTWKRAGGLFALCAIYGVADELLQIPVGRSADVRDWFADMRGVLTALVIVMVVAILTRRFPRRDATQRTEK